MQNDLTAIRNFAHEMRVANIAGDDVDLILHVRGSFIEPAPRVKRIVNRNCTDLCTLAHESFRQMATDEAIGTRHQQSLAF